MQQGDLRKVQFSAAGCSVTDEWMVQDWIYLQVPFFKSSLRISFVAGTM